jgi:hypothetical protein
MPNERRMSIEATAPSEPIALPGLLLTPAFPIPQTRNEERRHTFLSLYFLSESACSVDFHCTRRV